MKIFDSEGMLIIPSPLPPEIKESKKALVVQHCYCQHGHSLINPRANFCGYNGIFIKVRSEDKEGFIALSPVFGDKSKISLDFDLVKDEVLQIMCPKCEESLPVFSPCSCGADLIALFNTRDADFANCIGICSRIGCFNAVVKSGNELLTQAMIDAL